MVAREKQKDGNTMNGSSDTESNGGAVDTMNAIALSSEESEGSNLNGILESKRSETKIGGMMKNTKYHMQEEKKRSVYDALDRRIDELY